jgi:hypothetical protein
MYLNWLLIPTLLGTLLFCLIGLRISTQENFSLLKLAFIVLAIILSLPAFLSALYYVHVLDRAAWFYAFRAMPYSEILASGIGFGLGLLLGGFRRKDSLQYSSRTSIATFMLVLLCSGLLLVPYLKPIIAPLQVPLKSRWSQDVCLQSTSATCGPCSAATLLKQFGVEATESELARECFTYRGGTENWYVVRALQRRGLHARTVVGPPEPPVLPVSAIAGVRLGSASGGGHFIAILSRKGNRTVVGDPLVGRITLSARQLRTRYYFTGYFLIVSRERSG